MEEYYLQTEEVVKEEDNGEETTYFIKGKISKNGEIWEDCLFIWDGDMDGKNR